MSLFNEIGNFRDGKMVPFQSLIKYMFLFCGYCEPLFSIFIGELSVFNTLVRPRIHFNASSSTHDNNDDRNEQLD
ncbi:hypothetical protein Y032_0269g809 [Ancylostoma ceylanicum]|uniref:Uncharacterized protein n=1 Tax=Ancylostoma ceylanicum TaxID=53326 RepID=A0A016S9A9_9BILA|nr:hypothetical protein Y032_0269g809 [Ancylostoma ceylanicum]